MRGRFFGRIIFISLLGLLGLFSTPVVAADVVSAPPAPVVLPSSPLIITALKSTKTSLNFIQIYNTSDQPINLTGWKVQTPLKINDTKIPPTLATLSGWIAPHNYLVASEDIVVSDETVLSGGDFPLTNMTAGAGQSVSEVFLVAPSGTFKNETIKPVLQDSEHFLQRNKSTSSGKFIITELDGAIIYGGGVYDLPSNTNLQIAEILPVARDCSPIETSKDCGDYIKIYNPTTQSIDLSQFRLRSGHQGQSSSVTNSFLLDGKLPSGYYLVVNSRDDNVPLSITNTGGYVWIEDTYGVKIYDQTIVEYPDASSTTKKGVSWAYDSSDGTWKWAVPSPSGDNTFLPPEVEQPAVSSSSNLKPCASNQYRNLSTNRCRLISSASSSLKPCRADQFRNPTTNRCRLISSSSSSLKPCRADQQRNSLTNRCRSIFSASSSLKPCQADQARNPATNRCRKIGAGSSSLKPCAANQERNSETNRCRKKAVLAANAIKDVASKQTKSQTGWLVAGGAAATIGGYGAWEWRSEMTGLSRKLLKVFGKSPPLN